MKKYFIVGNRAFETWIQASEYYEENDFDGETMIVEVNDGKRMSSYDKTNSYNIGYKDEKINLRTIYTIEYITNKHDFDAVCTGSLVEGIEPWERYQKIQTEDLQNAITIFLAHYASKLTYDVKLYEEILLDGEIIREQYITDIMNFSGICDNHNERLRERYNQAEESKQYLQDEIDMVKELFGAKQYGDFIQKKRNEKRA